MTYIVPGKFKNNPFLMVDCVATGEENNTKIYLFRNKLKKLISAENETYFCLTGADAYQYAIEGFDEKCYWNDEKFDFKNIEHIEEILDLFKTFSGYTQYNKGTKIGNFCRLYFINKSNVYYYNIDDDGKLTHLHEIPNNSFIKPNDATNDPVTINSDFENNEQLIDFCKNEILRYKGYNGLDFKDKFSYVTFSDNGKLISNSLKNNKEIVLSMIAGDYSEI